GSNQGDIQFVAWRVCAEQFDAWQNQRARSGEGGRFEELSSFHDCILDPITNAGQARSPALPCPVAQVSNLLYRSASSLQSSICSDALGRTWTRRSEIHDAAYLETGRNFRFSKRCDYFCRAPDRAKRMECAAFRRFQWRPALKG